MKKGIIFLLALALLAFGGSALAQSDLAAIAAANTIEAAHEMYASTLCTDVYYDLETGEISETLKTASFKDPELGMVYTMYYENGDVQVWHADCTYGCYGNGTLFLAAFLDDGLARTYGSVYSMGEFAAGQTITEESVAEDGTLLMTVEGAIAEDNTDYGAENVGLTLVTRYEIDPDTLIVRAYENSIRGEDGVERLRNRGSYETNVEIVLPFDEAEILSPKATREVRVIVDPGTDKETEHVFTAPLTVYLGVYLPDGYTLYGDAACTEDVPEGYYAPEEGVYPETLTIYCGPAAE